MKSVRLFFLLCFVAMIAACSGNQGQPTNQGQPLPGPTTYPPPGTNTNTNTTSIPAPTGNVQHYTCPNNCEGSGGSVGGTCPVCGTEYTHNAAFHAQPANTTTTITPPTTTTGTDPASTGTTPLPTPTSAANANGVFHYTCPAGCEGGAATAGVCAGCGGELAHNPAFHQ